MKKYFFLLSFTIQFLLYSQTVVINEIDVDNPSVDTQEFIELKSETPNFILDNYVLVFFNGSTSGNDSSYLTMDLGGAVTDENGLLLIGSSQVNPLPQLLISSNIIQNGADAVAIYEGNSSDFPEGTLATQTNLIDALVYDTSDSDDTVLMGLLGVTEQINEGSSGNTNSIQRNSDGSYSVSSPTPRQLNDGSGLIFNALKIITTITKITEGDNFEIVFQAENNVNTDYTFTFTINNYNFNNADFSGNTTLTIPAGTNEATTTITITDDTINEGDEELSISFNDLTSPLIPYNGAITIRVEDNDFTVANFGTPLNPTYGNINGSQPTDYYDSLNGLSGNELEQAIQNIITEEGVVRAQTYTDIIDILEQADENPENSSQVWMVYTEEGRSKLDYQTTSDNTGKWNREHTFPRSLAGYYNIDADDIRDGINSYWQTNADSLRHGNSDAHALRVADGPENSSRGNKHYGEYNGPEENAGSFKGDVARSVLYMQLRYNGLSIEEGFTTTTGSMGDLTTLLEWHRNDPPDDFEMNRNNVIYNWQFNRNPLIDLPDLVEYIWGEEAGNIWNPSSLSTDIFSSTLIKTYPNPITDKLFISGDKSYYNISIYNLNGKEILKTVIENDHHVDLKISSGLYFLKISSENNSTTRKILVE